MMLSLFHALRLPWAWKMAWRDTRRSRHQLLLYSMSIVLGVAALVAVGSFGVNLQSAIETQAKTLLGADLAITSNSEFSAEQKAFLDSLGGIQAREVNFSSMAYFPRTQSSRLAQIRAVEGDFPFYGRLETDPEQALSAFREGAGALVEESLLKQFGLIVGDTVKIGQILLPIQGSLLRVPGEMGTLGTFAPRVYVPLQVLPETGLLGKGSLVRQRVYFKFAPEKDVSWLVAKIRPTLQKFQLEVDTVERRQRNLGRAMTNLYHFLNLVGFVALLLGGIGIASAVHVHVKQKLPTVAILRSLGCTSSQVFAVYLVQGVGLGLIGASVGASLGVAVQMSFPVVLADFVPLPLSMTISWLAVLQGAGLGFIISLLFALLPLLSVRRVPPLAVLRASVEQGVQGRDPWVWLCYSLIAGGLLAFSITQSRRWEVGVGFALGVGVAFALLTGLAKGLTTVLRRSVIRVGPFTWRQGLASLYRPNNRTVLLMLCLGLGTFLILTLYLLQTNLVAQILPNALERKPDAVLFDVQQDQRDGVTQLLQSQQLPVLQDVPIVTMRLSEIKGRTVERIRNDPRRDIPNWALRREYRSTYREELEDSESLRSGVWHPRVPAGTNLNRTTNEILPRIESTVCSTSLRSIMETLGYC